MNFILDPNFAFVILAVAFLVTIFALLAPGTGILEVISLLLLTVVGFSIANLPIHSWAIILLLGGIVAILLSLRRFNNRYLLALSIVLLLAGMLFLFRVPGQFLGVDPLLGIITSAATACFIWIVGRMTAKAFEKTPQQNLESLIGKVGRAVTDVSSEGSVYVEGENWSAESDKLIKKGSDIIVRERNGLILKVEAAPRDSKK